ncbi:MAG: hypothetical protein Q8M31_04215 [Beijerinckiaceae bacterium]|nr:hypothetical protein [Beijerinckiaceae bacterium]
MVCQNNLRFKRLVRMLCKDIDRSDQLLLRLAMMVRLKPERERHPRHHRDDKDERENDQKAGSPSHLPHRQHDPHLRKRYSFSSVTY